MLHIYDSMHQQKRVFVPQTPGQVNMYVCGITVYDDSHLGHARTYVAFDVVHRYLHHCGYRVHLVRNITDVDDKIIARAREKGITETALTDTMIARMHHDLAALGILPVTYEPRATTHIPAMCTLIQTLLDKQAAYMADNGDVYFHVEADPHYGCLSHQNREALQVGARVERETAKKNPLDFVLWKRAKPEEPAWDAPWGRGRPGWHIECSAMAMQYLGTGLDIHGGGRDLLFPHHENERAQSEQATGTRFAQYWMHTGYLEVDAVKMSKSLGNFLTIRQALAQYPAEVLRYFLISSHYRSPITYSTTHVEQARTNLDKLYRGLRGWVHGPCTDPFMAPPAQDIPSTKPARDPALQSAVDAFHAAMDDDFNTPVALSVLFDMLKTLHTCDLTHPADRERGQAWAETIRELGTILGILQQDPVAYCQQTSAPGDACPDPAWIASQIAARTAARAARDWKQADAIRQTLWEQGIGLEDGPQGTQWHRIGDPPI